MNKNPHGIVPILVVVILALIGLGIIGYLSIKPTITPPSPAPILSPTQNLTSNWKVYRNEAWGFEFEYPGDLIDLTENVNSVSLKHSVPHRHPNPCNLSGLQEKPLEKLTDLDISFEVTNNSLLDVIKNQSKFIYENYLDGNELKLEPGFIERTIIGNVEGYRITSGSHGCGNYTYYISHKSNSTLIVTRSFIPELKPIIANYQEYLNIPGIIHPDEEEKLFNQILSTFQFIK